MLRDFISRRALVASAIGALFLSACANAPSLNAPPEVRAALAPTGVLRIAVYPGSPTSLVKEAPPDEMRGVSVDLGHALAARLDVPAKVQVYPLLAPALAAVQRGEADFTVTNATAERAKLVDFGPPLVDLELGVLVPAGSRVSSVDAIDRPGIVVGVSQGSSSERVLGGRYANARLRSFATLEAARAALVAREIDAYATNKGILYELSDRVPGSRVLEGRWGAEHLAAAIPKGREAGLAFLRTFSEEVRTSGELDRAAKRAGLRGSAAPEP